MGGSLMNMARVTLRFVQSYNDRHGTPRHYFRRGKQRALLPGLPGSREFMEAYAAALAQQPAPTERKLNGKPGTFAALASAYYGSPNYLRLNLNSRRVYRRIIDHFVTEHGDRLLAQFRREHVDRIIGKINAKPGAAVSLLKRIRTLVRYGMEIGWLDRDPTAGARAPKSGEFHTWTEEEIRTFEARWEVGTKQRLAFALLLYTGQRGSDVHRMTWQDIAGNKVRVVQTKTKAKLAIPLHPALLECLAVARRTHITIVPTEYGSGFSVKGFGQWMSAAIRASGVSLRCKAHGLRKAAARRLAEAGCTAHEIASITGHRTLSEVERYTRAADQERLSEAAMGKQVGNTIGLPRPVVVSNGPQKGQK